jgi:hypothetical protein
MAASDITFTRRTDKIADLIYNAGFWGQRNELIKKDPIDQMYEQCYPPEAGSNRTTSVIAEEMIQRRREKATLDALEELVSGGLGGGASCSSASWLLFRPLAGEFQCRAAGGVGLTDGSTSTPGR